MINDVLALARAKGIRITAAESCTGGMLAAALTEVAGSSDVFDRGFVTYSNAAKIQMLGVAANDLDTFGAVSEVVARGMAIGALERSNSHIAIAITGIAGPGGSQFKPEGRVCFALATHQRTDAETAEYGPIGRANVRTAARDHALSLILAALQK
jgi:nicotinamide-nucleotide amidase